MKTIHKASESTVELVPWIQYWQLKCLLVGQDVFSMVIQWEPSSTKVHERAMLVFSNGHKQACQVDHVLWCQWSQGMTLLHQNANRSKESVDRSGLSTVLLVFRAKREEPAAVGYVPEQQPTPKTCRSSRDATARLCVAFYQGTKGFQGIRW